MFYNCLWAQAALIQIILAGQVPSLSLCVCRWIIHIDLSENSDNVPQNAMVQIILQIQNAIMLEHMYPERYEYTLRYLPILCHKMLCYLCFNIDGWHPQLYVHLLMVRPHYVPLCQSISQYTSIYYFLAMMFVAKSGYRPQHRHDFPCVFHIGAGKLDTEPYETWTLKTGPWLTAGVPYQFRWFFIQV